MMRTRFFKMLRHIGQLAFVTVVLAVAAFGQAPAPATAAKSYSDDVAKITAGNDSTARRKAIEASLKAAGIEHKAEDFAATSRGGREVKGTNVIATIPAAAAKRTIMLGAHLDRVAVGVGAIDNASGTAAVLELLRAFKARPLKNVTLMAGFWDQEEVGLVGSRAYVQSREKGGLPAVYINFDVYGAGDTIWLWSPDENMDFAKSLVKSSQDAKFKHFVSKDYPPSDHRSFAVPGVESYSFSLGPAGEAKNIINVLKGQVDPANFPKVLQVIHTENDTLDKIDANAVVRSLVVIEAAIRALDK
jgi:aminopeptidase S